MGALVLGGGGSAAYHHFLGNGAGSNACSADGDRDVTVSRKSLDEPTVVIPTTAGWGKLSPNRIRELESTGLELSPRTRDVFLNNGIRENNFTPNIVVSAGPIPNRGLTDEAINDHENRDLAKTETITDTSTLSICGNTVFRTESSLPGPAGELPRHHTDLFAIQRNGDSIWAVDVSILTTNPENPEFIAQRDALLEGLRVELPEN